MIRLTRRICHNAVSGSVLRLNDSDSSMQFAVCYENQ